MIDRAWRITRTAHICIVWRLRLRLRLPCSARASTSRSAYGSVRIHGWRGGTGGPKPGEWSARGRARGRGIAAAASRDDADAAPHCQPEAAGRLNASGARGRMQIL